MSQNHVYTAVTLVAICQLLTAVKCAKKPAVAILNSYTGFANPFSANIYVRNSLVYQNDFISFTECVHIDLRHTVEITKFLVMSDLIDLF